MRVGIKRKGPSVCARPQYYLCRDQIPVLLVPSRGSRQKLIDVLVLPSGSESFNSQRGNYFTHICTDVVYNSYFIQLGILFT